MERYNMHEYVSKNTWGSVLQVSQNNTSLGAKAHSVFLEISRMRSDESAYTSVQGRAAVRKLVYSIAVIGGLIEDGEILVLESGDDLEVPVPGVYAVADSNRIVVVEDGKVWVPVVGNERMEDQTKKFLAEEWKLTFLKKEGE